jgi:hypothetical protein
MTVNRTIAQAAETKLPLCFVFRLNGFLSAARLGMMLNIYCPY